jgi:hypothetical protein
VIEINEEEVILNLIKQTCKENGSVVEERVFRMAQILNIQADKYEKIKTKLLETGKINKDGTQIFLL